ncbi:MAG: hypothetical protein K0R25_150 [Rickettsiaceae bacterium]|jgi:polyhydroxyalkanoate synthesis regulator phasin|nr:hypothetical protein [Rickettsiaceae bacterium]
MPNKKNNFEKIDELLKKLSPWKRHRNRVFEEIVHKIFDYTAAVKAGKMTPDEMDELIGDLSDLKKQAEYADEIIAAQEINRIANLIIDSLKKAAGI